MATTRRMWMKPPMVYDETKPSSQRMSRTIAMVYNITLRGKGLLRFAQIRPAQMRFPNPQLLVSIPQQIRQ